MNIKPFAAVVGLFAALLIAGPAGAQDAAGTTDEDALLEHATEPWTGDLDGMVERGFVRLLTTHNPLYLTYDGIDRKGLAVELAPEGFRVNALCPAAGDTPMLAEFMGGEATTEGRARFESGLPLGKLITPEDMGNAAVFLASDAEAGTITGCALPVDSGRCI